MNQPEPSEAEVAAEMERLERDARPAIYLAREDFPTRAPLRSYFGGLPRLPVGVDWPRVTSLDGGEIAPTFVFQVQLEDLPSFTGREALPKSGVLYFFVDTNFEGNGEPACAVLLHDGDAGALAETPPPPDLMLLAGELDFTNQPWVKPDEPFARRDFRYPMKPFAIMSHRSFGDDEMESWIAFRAARTRLADAALEKVMGPQKPAPETRKEPPAGWPWAGVFVVETARGLASALDQYINPPPWQSIPTPEDCLALYRRLTSEANAWRDTFDGDRLGASPNETERQEFRAWFEGAVEAIAAIGKAENGWGTRRSACNRTELERRLEQALKFAARRALADEFVCDDVAEAGARQVLDVNEQYWRHMNHQMLGHGQSYQNAPADHIDDVLLLQIAGDQGLAWHNNMGCVLQFWISHEDLAARRFDRVQATLECD